MNEQERNTLLAEFDPPAHVRRHCETVASFALKVGRQLTKNGLSVDLSLLENAALLHDIVRVVDFKIFNPSAFPVAPTDEQIAHWEKLRTRYAGMHHADAAGIILRERGHHDVAVVVEKHKYLQIKEGFSTWEEKLLYYADKRAKHDMIVSIDERLADGRNRNAPDTKDTQEARELDAKVHALEQEIITAAHMQF